MSRAVVALALLAAVWIPGCGGGEPAATVPDPAAYVAEIEAWHAERESRLAAPEGWLSLVALEWLAEGENSVGSAAGADVRLPSGDVPETVGALELADGTVRFLPAPDGGASIDGRPVVGPTPMLPDTAPEGPTTVATGRLTWYVIERDARFGVRVKDPRSPAIAAFDGIETYPIDPAWRVEATFTPYDQPVEIRVPTVVDTEQRYWEPGRLELRVDGHDVELTPLVSEPDDDELFIMFRDGTTGSETYGAGRYLYAPLEGRTAIVDFNRAYNPPCAFSPYATCPLPPPGNRLPLRVTAGERRYGDH